MSDKEMIEKIRVVFSKWEGSYADMIGRIAAIISPSKPLGFIYADDLPKVGTVFVMKDGKKRTVLRTDCDRVGWMVEWQEDNGYWRCDDTTIEWWNEVLVAEVISVIPPAEDGEVERLKAGVAAFRQCIEELKKENVRLKAELAKSKALLDGTCHSYDDIGERLRAKIRELQAAEPVKPKIRLEATRTDEPCEPCVVIDTGSGNLCTWEIRPIQGENAESLVEALAKRFRAIGIEVEVQYD